MSSLLTRKPFLPSSYPSVSLCFPLLSIVSPMFFEVFNEHVLGALISFLIPGDVPFND